MPPENFPDASFSGPDGWTIRRRESGADFAARSGLPGAGEREWRLLGRHQRAADPATVPFNPGWSRMTWEPAALVVEFFFAATSASNSARRLNERTHLLGDVGEIFLQGAGIDRYIEIHVTPENQRLQLEWSRERLEAVRNQQAKLEDFVHPDPNWVQSCTLVTPTGWSAAVRVPADAVLGRGALFQAGARLLVAVCRYDYSGGHKPVLSSTANFRGQPFHTTSAWHTGQLQ